MCGAGDFFQFRLNVKNAGAIFSSQFHIHINVKVFVHVFMQPCLVRVLFFMWWRKNGWGNFFNNSRGMLMWVRIIPVKVDQSLTGIIRTYIFDLMDAKQRRLKSNHNCATESRSLDTGIKRSDLQGKLVTLDFSPLSLYQELHVILLLAKIMNGNIDIDWTRFMSGLDYGATRNSQTRNFVARPMGLKKCESDF